MMELTPLDVRKKKGDFRRSLRGYEPAVVDDFLDIVADRMEKLVREVAALKETVSRMEQQVTDFRDREKALTEALVTAQEMREEIRAQSARETDLLRRQAEQDAEEIRGEAVRAREREEESLNALRRKQLQFLASYRSFLEQELAELAAHARGLEMQSGKPPAAPPSPARPGPAPGASASSEKETPEPAPARPTAVAPDASPPAPPAPEAVAGASAAAAVGTPAPEPPEAGSVENDVDAQVGAALDEWGTEFDEVAGDDAPDLILSDADVVVEESAMLADGEATAEGPASAEAAAERAAPGAGTAGPPEPETPAYDESAFRADVGAAFGDPDEGEDDLLDLESFDSLQGGPDPALGESIVGPPPVVPPDELTINPVFLDRAEPEDSEESGPDGGTEESPKPDRYSSMFEDDG